MTLFEMDPRIAPDNLSDVLSADPVFPTEHDGRDFPEAILGSDRSHDARGGFRLAMSLANRLAALRDLVGIVGRLISEKQMPRVATRRVVAVVKNVCAIGYWFPGVKLKGQTMGQHEPPRLEIPITPAVQVPVPEWSQGAFPSPAAATASTDYGSPKFFGGRRFIVNPVRKIAGTTAKPLLRHASDWFVGNTAFLTCQRCHVIHYIPILARGRRILARLL